MTSFQFWKQTKGAMYETSCTFELVYTDIFSSVCHV